MENEICLANHTLLSIHEKYRNACPLELEHIEICFKPKEKYMGAFEKLQQLFPLIKRIGIKNVETCEYEDEFLDLCKNYLNAIDLETGELNMLNLLQQFEGVVTGIDVKRFVKDNDLKKEVLEALEALYEADEVEVENKYFYEMSTVTIEQIMLNDYILDGEKTATLVFLSFSTFRFFRG